MHRGFIINNIHFDTGPYYKIGQERFELQKATVEKNLKAFMFGNNTLDASRIQSNWFPQVKAHVFLSHSHRDADDVISFAGWLYHHFALEAFIDSTVWGYGDDLLKIIDDTYSRDDKGAFDYAKRNTSTSHVHMMLCTALAMMIDKTECLFFMDTPNSIMPTESIQKTLSPWIYFEIATSQMIRKKDPVRKMESLAIAYTLDLNHLATLDQADMNNWSGGNQLRDPLSALDRLYSIKPAEQQTDILLD